MDDGMAGTGNAIGVMANQCTDSTDAEAAKYVSSDDKICSLLIVIRQ